MLIWFLLQPLIIISQDWVRDQLVPKAMRGWDTPAGCVTGVIEILVTLAVILASADYLFWSGFEEEPCRLDRTGLQEVQSLVQMVQAALKL
jgi:hypothetical protein